MTADQVSRAAELLRARTEIIEFFSARDAESALVQGYLKSKYEHQVREGKALPNAGVVEVSIRDAPECIDMEDGADTICGWCLPRDVVETALKAQLPVLEAELRELGVSIE